MSDNLLTTGKVPLAMMSQPEVRTAKLAKAASKSQGKL